MDYHNIKVHLTKNQLEKIAHAIKHDTEFTIRVEINSNGNHNLQVTKRQYNKLMKGGKHDLEFSKTHIHHLKKSGGFLPLLAAIPAIAALLGGVGGLSGGIATAVSKAKDSAELARHNKAMEGRGLYLHPQQTNARGLHLSPAGRGHRKRM